LAFRKADGPVLATSWLKEIRSRAQERIMSWTGDFSAGIRELGEQHKGLFERLVFVKETMAKGAGWNEMQAALLSLITRFESCFAVEETLMRIHGYPGCELHAQEHVGLLLRLRAMETANLTSGLTEKMIGTAFATTMRHHLTQDRPYARYLPQARGQA
jgi:hemerythrin